MVTVYILPRWQKKENFEDQTIVIFKWENFRKKCLGFKVNSNKI